MISTNMTREAVEAAAFWEEALCLSCDSRIADVTVYDCPTCGERAFPASTILELIEQLDNETSGKEEA